MISVVTPTYHTDPDVLARTWASLKNQSYSDWDWVIYDDSQNDLVWRQIYGFMSDERFRITAYRGDSHLGSIGAVKNKAFMLATGDILVELDHDDELTPNCLQEIDSAFKDEKTGCVYSDWCEIFPDGTSGRYPVGWAYGYGSDYWSNDYNCWVMSAPEINDITMRHIVSMPNHIRAWRSSVYRDLGGHNSNLEVADDYDLCIRTALYTKCQHIPKLLYKQHIGMETAQRIHKEKIQQYVEKISKSYDKKISQKFGQSITKQLR